MNIGIIGAGSVGQLYAKLWRDAGHNIMISSRHPEKHSLSRLAENGVMVGSPENAAKFGDIILLAVNYGTLESAIDAIQPYVNGKLVIDATNPLVLDESGKVKRVIPDNAIAGMLMQERLPQAWVAKAFTSLWTGHVEHHSNVQSPKVAMPIAADCIEDQNVVSKLVLDAGLQPVLIGTLAESRPLDPPSSIWNIVLTEFELRERIHDQNLAMSA